MLGTLAISMALIQPRKLPAPRRAIDTRAFRQPAFLVFSVASFTAFMGLYIPFFYIQQYTEAHVVPAKSDKFAPYMLTFLNAGSVAGRIVPGFVADELGLLNTMIICTTGAMVCAFIWLVCDSFGSITALAIFYGFFSGTFVSLQPAVLSSLSPEPSSIGTWVGMGSLFAAIGLLIGPPIGGLVFRIYDWPGLQLFCAFLVLVAVIATTATRIICIGRSLRKKA